ncbi:MAG: disulfide bond formation protein B [Immundisolibacteraceae bacterium]|nr:disulfide bond formation protein B [Immundisolibacteraceae bacterium]
MMNGLFGRRRWYALLVLTVIGLVAAAIGLQIQLDLDPCPLCIAQRIVFFSLGGWFLIAALHGPQGWGRWVYGGVSTLIGLIGVGISGRHVWLQSLPADQVPSCGPGLEFILDAFPLMDALQLILQGSGECAELSWSFLGLSMPGWALVWFVVLIIAGMVPVTQRFKQVLVDQEGF